MGLESFSFFLFERDRDVFVPRAWQGLDEVFYPQPEVLNTLYSDDPLVIYLEKEKRQVMRDDLDQIRDKEVISQMDELKAYITLPLLFAGRLTGILNLGPKKNKEIFHEKDLELIKDLAKSAERHLLHISFFENSLFFSGGLAHDIRKPFRQGIIYSYLEKIQDGLLNSDQKEALDGLTDRLRSLDIMSENMVDTFKSLEIFLKGGFKPEKIDYLKEITEEIIPFKDLAREKGIELETEFSKKEIFVYADPLSVRRILNEILSNAFKYTDRGKIKIKVSQNNQEILTEITDTGCGICEEKQKDIWELFKRGEDRREGEGIGLALVKQLIEANAGKIWMESEIGKGSSFYFILPSEK